MDKGGLIDYLVIAGARSPNGSPVQDPKLLKRYPAADHKPFALPQDVTYFCQPEGCINVCKRANQNLNQDTTSFVFTLTDKDSGHIKYGVCVNFYRPLDKRDLLRLRNKKDKKRRKKEKDIINKQNGDINQSNESSNESDNVPAQVIKCTNNATNGEIKTKKKQNRMIRTHTLTSLCILSHYPFISGFRRCLLTLKRIIEACYHRIEVKNGKSSKKYSSIWTALLDSIFTDSPSISGVLNKEVQEIESWILKLLETPAPEPGKSKTLLELLPADMQSPLVFALPDSTRMSLVDFPFHLPFELLGVDLCLNVLTAILLEYKVVLRSRDYNALSMSVLAMTQMIYPLQYMFPIIPLLPVCMPGVEQLFLAPTPYLIGIPTLFFDQHFTFPDDICLIDLDSNKMTLPKTVSKLPKLPEPAGGELKTRLKEILASMSLNPPSVPNQSECSETESKNPSNNSLIYGNDVDSIDMAARVALVSFIFSSNVLLNYSEHYRTLRLFPRPVVAFQKESFLQSRPNQTTFIKKLAETQAVEYLGEWSLAPTNVAYLRIQSNVYDPALIGDKSKWFNKFLKEVDHSAIDGTTVLVPTLASIDDLSMPNNSEEEPTDESGCESDDLENSTSESYSTFSSEEDQEAEEEESEQVDAMNGKEEHGEKGNSEPVVDRNDSKQPIIPTSLESLTLNPSTLNNNGKLNEALSPTGSQSSRGSSAPIETDIQVEVTKAAEKVVNNIKTTFESLTADVENNEKKSVSPTSDRKTPFPSIKGPKRTLIDHRSVIRHGTPIINTVPEQKAQTYPSAALNTAENQQFLKEVTQSVVEGNGVGWFNLKKTKRLMENEDLRLLLLQRLNQSTQDEQNLVFVEDLEIGRRVYKGMAELLKCVVFGLEHTYKVMNGLGGLASTFQLLEIVHTHYYAKEVKQSDEQRKEDLKTDVSESDEKQAALSKQAVQEKRNLAQTTDPKQDDMDNKSVISDASVTGTLCDIRYRNGRIIRVDSDIDEDEERVYLYEALLGKERSPLWNDMKFWECAYLDAVVMERDAVGLDQGPIDMMQRYKSLGPVERKRLEEEEDRLLSTLLYNMVGSMVMLEVPHDEIKKKIRRLLGKSHIGLAHSNEINVLLDNIEGLVGVCVDLKPCGSRHIRKQSFVVHSGTDTTGDILFMEVCDDAIILRTGFGTICQRWWYEKLINMTFCPKTKVLCLWRRNGAETQLNKFYTKKCRELYHCVKEAMEKAAARHNELELGGEFPVQDMKTGECGLLQVTLDGINLKLSSGQVFLNLRTIKKCNTVKGVFILEQYRHETDEVILHKFKSSLASEICYAVLCLFSYVAAGKRASKT